MKFKKLASILVVVGAMVATMSVSAHALSFGGTTGGTTNPPATDTSATSGSGSGSEDAASEDASESKVEVSSTVQTPTIKVEVSTASAIVINPYQLKVTVDKKTVTDAIISAPFILTNLSDCELAMTCKATLTTADTLSVVDKAASVEGKDGAKNVFLQLGVARVKDTKSLTSIIKDGAIDASVLDTPLDTKDTNKQLITLKKDTAVGFGSKGDESMRLPLTDGKAAKYVAFQFTGAVASNTTTPWTATDTVSANIVLTFTPQVETKAPATT